MTRFAVVTEMYVFEGPTLAYGHSNLLKAFNFHQTNNIPGNYSTVYRKIRKDGFYSWIDGSIPWRISKIVIH